MRDFFLYGLPKFCLTSVDKIIHYNPRVVINEVCTYASYLLILLSCILQVKRLLEVPSNGVGVSWMKILASVGVAATGAALASGLYLTCRR